MLNASTYATEDESGAFLTPSREDSLPTALVDNSKLPNNEDFINPDYRHRRRLKKFTVRELFSGYAVPQVECGIGSHLRDLRDAYFRSCTSRIDQIRRAPFDPPVCCRYHRLVGALLGRRDFDGGGLARSLLIPFAGRHQT